MGKLDRTLSFAPATSQKLEELHVRAQGSRPKRRWYLIVCEGEATEPNYFGAMRKRLYGGEGDRIVIHGAGDNTLNLVDIAKETIAQRMKSGDPPFYHVWLVFDRDSFPPDDFDNTIQLAADEDAKFDPENGYKPHWHSAWSNEAFELWYLYHFQEVQGGGLSREKFKKMLTKHLVRPYLKNDSTMFEELLPHIDLAIIRAKRAYEKWPSTTAYHDRNPATAVYRLVADLLRYM